MSCDLKRSIFVLWSYMNFSLSQSYTASVEGGTDPSFRWTVDDKPYFTYYNTVLNIIYQNAAVYKLTVRICLTNNVKDIFNGGQF